MPVSVLPDFCIAVNFIGLFRKVLLDNPIRYFIPFASRDRCDKAKTLPRDCLNKLSAVLSLAKGLPQRPNVLGEIRFLDETVRPQSLHQLFLFDQVTGSLYEENQGVESFWSYGNGLAIAQKAALVWFKLKCPELVQVIAGLSHFTPL
jgi:hypothetical protein